ncbi:MAG: type II toxin-antitoxin system Phd/YefM family antitoxin [Pedosphaera sp.]|nr:type II toxin-antitoxin system Phd/YefM family antitoxin [Pedosphaera sp.]
MSQLVVDIREAEADFASLTARIRRGETILICDASLPLAEIRPLPQPSAQRRPFGLARGLLSVPHDFGAPDPEIERMFYASV